MTTYTRESVLHHECCEAAAPTAFHIHWPERAASEDMIEVRISVPVFAVCMVSFEELNQALQERSDLIHQRLRSTLSQYHAALTKWLEENRVP